MIYIIECNERIVGACDNELDVLRCLVLHGMIDPSEVDEALRAQENPVFHDVWTWLSSGVPMDAINRFLKFGRCVAIPVNSDPELHMSFENKCKEVLPQKEHVIYFEDGDRRKICASFLAEAESMAEKYREAENLPRSPISFCSEKGLDFSNENVGRDFDEFLEKACVLCDRETAEHLFKIFTEMFLGKIK